VYERQPEDFEKLLGLPGVGAKTLRALSLISELVYGVAPSYRDPARTALRTAVKMVSLTRWTARLMINPLNFWRGGKQTLLGINEKNEAMNRLRRLGLE